MSMTTSDKMFIIISDQNLLSKPALRCTKCFGFVSGMVTEIL